MGNAEEDLWKRMKKWKSSKKSTKPILLTNSTILKKMNPTTNLKKITVNVKKRGLGWLNKKKPQKNCVTQKKCVNIPKKNCGIHKKETCIPFPKKKCETKMIEKCQTVQRQECKEVIERRPRLVCPPPPTTRTISEPVYAREADVVQTYTKDSLINQKLGKFRG